MECQRTDSTDLLIVGASFSGLTLAYSVHNPGLRSLIVERKRRLWSPSTGLITPPTLKLLEQVFPFGIPIIRAFTSMKVIFKDVGEVLLNSREPFLFLLDKDSFFSAAEEHLPSSFTLALGCSFVKTENKTAKVQTHYTETSIRYDLLVGADGALSKVAKSSGLPLVKEWLYGYEWKISQPAVDDFITFVVDPTVSRAYGIWMFPVNGGVRMGLASKKPLRKTDVQSIMKQYFSFDGPLLDYKGGAIPISGPVRAPFKEDVILLGDAAGLCGPFLGDGIQTAVKSGIAAARAVEQPNVGPAYVELLKKTEVTKYLKQQALLRSIWDRFVSKNTLKRLYKFTLRNQDHLLDDLTTIKEDPSSFLQIARKFFG